MPLMQMFFAPHELTRVSGGKPHWPENTYASGYLPTPEIGGTTVVFCLIGPRTNTWSPPAPNSARDFTYGRANHVGQDVSGWQQPGSASEPPGWRLAPILSPMTRVLAAGSRERNAAQQCYFMRPTTNGSGHKILLLEFPKNEHSLC